MRRHFIILFLLIFFTAGCASENSTQPSQLPPDPTGYTVSEDLYGHDQSVRLESLFDADDILTETSETAFYKNGNLEITNTILKGGNFANLDIFTALNS